jgi:hypothetical protein
MYSFDKKTNNEHWQSAMKIERVEGQQALRNQWEIGIKKNKIEQAGNYNIKSTQLFNGYLAA